MQVNARTTECGEGKDSFGVTTSQPLTLEAKRNLQWGKVRWRLKEVRRLLQGADNLERDSLRWMLSFVAT